MILDNLSTGHKYNIEEFLKYDRVEFIHGDISNLETCRKAMKDIDIVYHLAFINGTGNFYQKPGLVLDVGIKGMTNLIDLISTFYVISIIYRVVKIVEIYITIVEKCENVIE